jgi:high affinity Mn2+ porin
MAAGAVDFAADAKGYTDGFGIEYNRREGAARFGMFQVSREANSKALNADIGKAWQMLAEFEERFSLFDRPGRIRELAMMERVNGIVYGEFTGLAPISVSSPPTQIQAYRENYGLELNLEQELADDLGLFSRLSWNPGRVQEYMFTEIDRSASLGLSLKGLRWGRPDDTVGLAGVVNGLSANHRSFLAAGNFGFITGDGMLNYATEQVLETYYSYQILPGTAFTLDYQFADNPAYNASRGPISLFAIRFHAEY